jgi:ankyrin repeat protein
VCALLVHPGVEVNRADKDGCTPLYAAANNGHAECVRALLASPGIEVNRAENGYGWTPLKIARVNKKDYVAVLLCASGGRE